MSFSEKYEAVIGLEVHAKLSTKSKIFCSCSTAFGAQPNTHVCPVCMGLPGTLPSLNSEAVRLAVLTGLATNCEISPITAFDRKNYFYPDLPKAYQITQSRMPLCRNGYLDITVGDASRRIGIRQIHIEEDAGKLVHHPTNGTLIDYNRCGVPLIEIVTHPDMRSAEQAKAFLSELRATLLYVGASDCKMNQGSLRCDVNISVRKKGDTAFGVKTEIKNINSINFVGKAIELELERQATILESGGEVAAETRRFDDGTGKTHSMRAKETAEDYRYIPEPDLPPFCLTADYVDGLKKTLPIMPAERRRTYRDKYGITADDAEIIVSRPPMAEFFEQAANLTRHVGIVANVMITDLLSKTGADDFDVSITPEALAEAVTLYGDGEINSSTLKKLIPMLECSTLSPTELVKKHNMAQINDRETLTSILNKVISDTPKLFDDYKNGKTAAKKAIIGRVMAATQGRANPVLADEIFESVCH